jgi:hypothetical protein
MVDGTALNSLKLELDNKTPSCAACAKFGRTLAMSMHDSTYRYVLQLHRGVESSNAQVTSSYVQNVSSTTFLLISTGTIYTAIVDNFHPSPDNHVHHAVHDIGLLHAELFEKTSWSVVER